MRSTPRHDALCAIGWQVELTPMGRVTRLPQPHLLRIYAAVMGDSSVTRWRVRRAMVGADLCPGSGITASALEAGDRSMRASAMLNLETELARIARGRECLGISGRRCMW